MPGQTKTPALSGTLYTGPIPIQKTTCLRAVAVREGWKPSAVYTQTYIFVSDVIKQSPTGAQAQRKLACSILPAVAVFPGAAAEHR